MLRWGDPMRASAGLLKIAMLWAALLCLAVAPGTGRAGAQSAHQCAAAWDEARADGSAPAIEAFIRDYPACKEVREAQDRLELVSSPSLGGNRVRYSPVGRIVPPGAPLRAEGGGYGVVLLRRSMTDDRNLKACEVMHRALRFEVAAVDRRPERIDDFLVYRRPVYWPVISAPAGAEWTCAEMLGRYDAVRAWLPFDSPRFSRPGPYVVLIRERGDEAAVFDFSGVPADEFPRQFDAVVLHMTRDSSIWRESYFVESTFRQRMRKLLAEDNYDAVMVLASLVGLPRPGKR